jgi:hypothetical protein
LRPRSGWTAPTASITLSLVFIGMRKLRSDVLSSEDADDALEALVLDLHDWLAEQWRVPLTAAWS